MDALRDGAALEDLSGLIEAARSEMNEGEEGGSQGEKGKAGEKGKGGKEGQEGKEGENGKEGESGKNGEGKSRSPGRKVSSERLAEIMKRLSSVGGGRGGRAPAPGIGQGGEAPHGDDEGNKQNPDKVAGRIDPKGDLGDRLPFRGVPKAKDSRKAFDAAVDRAASAAEESLGKDVIPPDARAYVRRYFESLKKTEEPKEKK